MRDFNDSGVKLAICTSEISNGSTTEKTIDIDVDNICLIQVNILPQFFL